MLSYIEEFLSKEKEKKFVLCKRYPNGFEYIDQRYRGYNRLHTFYNPLNDEQIDKLQKDVGEAQGYGYIFPDWYREFFKTTNGLNIFYGSISFYGEQTPLIVHPKYGVIEALIERGNPNWIAPYNLRFTKSIKYDKLFMARWLTIASYHADGTQIVWDFKMNKIVAMHPLPATMSIKEKRKMKEIDYEKLIIAEWDNFETFFISETQRLESLFLSYKDGTEIDLADALFWKKTLPK